MGAWVGGWVGGGGQRPDAHVLEGRKGNNFPKPSNSIASRVPYLSSRTRRPCARGRGRRAAPGRTPSTPAGKDEGITLPQSFRPPFLLPTSLPPSRPPSVSPAVAPSATASFAPSFAPPHHPSRLLFSRQVWTVCGPAASPRPSPPTHTQTLRLFWLGSQVWTVCDLARQLLMYGPQEAIEYWQ